MVGAVACNQRLMIARPHGNKPATLSAWLNRYTLPVQAGLLSSRVLSPLILCIKLPNYHMHMQPTRLRFWKCLFSAALLFGALLPGARADHGYSLWGDLKYPRGFAHFDYVNINAPKGGDLALVSHLRYSTFDKYNPYSLKGSAPAYLDALVFESLLTSSMDEQGSAYGLLADDVLVAPDQSWVRFHINPKARFSNGDPVLAVDVIHSYNMLVSEDASPFYRTMLAGVEGVRAAESDERTVYYDITEFKRELPLIIGGLPVFSHKWGDGKPFGELTLEMPIASGPYTIGPVVYGRDITYVRNPDYWGKDLNVRRGMFNFDRITVRIYKDHTVRLEGFKAGEFDFMQEFSAGNWAKLYTGRRFDSGEVVKREFENTLPYGFQGYILNTRRPQLSDPRVRQALNLAYDFEWMNQALFYGSYRRIESYFGGSDYQAAGLPGKDELALLMSLQTQYGKTAVPDTVLYEPVPKQPVTTPPDSLRNNLRQARDLLAQAGWTYRDGALRNAQGEPFIIEYLDSQEGGGRVHAAWIRALEKLGVEFRLRVVDFSLYQMRLENFNFDVVSIRLGGSTDPGSELNEYYGSAAADQPHSANWWGIRNPAIDALIEKLSNAQSKDAAVAAGRALDRLLLQGHYSVLQFYSGGYRVAYDSSKLVVPEVVPGYYQAENWVMGVWWSKAAQESARRSPQQP